MGEDFRTIIQFFFSVSFPYSLLRNRKKLSCIFSTIDTGFIFSKNQRYNVFSGCILFILVVYPFIMIATFYADGDTYYLEIYSYNFTFKYQWMKFVIVFVKTLTLYIIHPIIPSVLAIMYCKLCHQCCSAMGIVIQRMEECKPMEFTAKTHKMFLKSREPIINVLDEIQDVFSVVSFSVCCAHFAGCLGAVAFFATIGGVSMVVEKLC